MKIPQPPITIKELRSKHAPLRDTVTERHKKLGLMERLAVWITVRVGSMGFFLLILAWTVVWLGWNSLAPKSLQFDPPMAFVFWLFISNVIQILLMPLIMVGQNVQGAAADARAEHDLRINVKAEAEIEVILSHLEYQNGLLIQMMGKIGEDVSEALDARPKKTAARPPTAPSQKTRPGKRS